VSGWHCIMAMLMSVAALALSFAPRLLRAPKAMGPKGSGSGMGAGASTDGDACDGVEGALPASLPVMGAGLLLEVLLVLHTALPAPPLLLAAGEPRQLLPMRPGTLLATTSTRCCFSNRPLAGMTWRSMSVCWLNGGRV
jgi:hypothetical protein